MPSLSQQMMTLSDSEGDKHALATQPSISQLVGTRSSKQYLPQYDQTSDGVPQPAILAPLQAPVPKDKEKQKEIRSDESLKKNPFRAILPSALTY